MNHQIIELMLREKREDLLREAERQRAIAEYEAGIPRKPNRLAVALGNRLIKLGEGLKRRYAQEAELSVG